MTYAPINNKYRKLKWTLELSVHGGYDIIVMIVVDDLECDYDHKEYVIKSDFDGINSNRNFSFSTGKLQLSSRKNKNHICNPLDKSNL